MADRARPWSKFFWSDFESDNALRQCSLAAQGLWMRILCICARSEPRGYLTVAGVDLDVAALATAVSRPETEVAPLLDELERWAVFSRDRKNRIYSRRMVRDEKRIKTATKNGVKGGNPRLSGGGVSPGEHEGNSGSDNPRVKGGVNTHIPEARSQSPEGENTSLRSVSSPEGVGEGEGEGDPMDERDRIVAAAWCRSDDVLGWCFACGRVSETLIRSTIEQWIKAHDPRVVREAIESAQCRGNVANALEYINRVLQNRRAKEGAGYLRVVPGGARQGSGTAAEELKPWERYAGMTEEDWRNANE